MTIIKSLLLSKLIYISSLLPISKSVIQEVNQLIFKFLWNGTDKVIRLSTINSYDEGGLKMIDLDSMIKALRLGWIKRIFSSSNGTWKSYLQYILKNYGGFLLFNCNYNIKDLSIQSQFYKELLEWWSEFREMFAEEKDWRFIIWNNKEIRLENKTVFYENYVNSGILCVNDLHLDVDNITSFNTIARNIDKNNFLLWTGLRHSVPSSLRHTYSGSIPDLTNPSFKYSNCLFDVTKNTSRDYYSLLVSSRARFPNNAINLTRDFNYTKDQLKQIYNLPHTVAIEPYLRAFQYKVLNSILYTNAKLFKIGFVENEKCSFCNCEKETLLHLMFHCPHSSFGELSKYISLN